MAQVEGHLLPRGQRLLVRPVKVGGVNGGGKATAPFPCCPVRTQGKLVWTYSTFRAVSSRLLPNCWVTNSVLYSHPSRPDGKGGPGRFDSLMLLEERVAAVPCLVP